MPTNTLNRATRAGSGVASEATDQARDVASSAAQRGGDLAQTAREETRELAQDVRERTGEVAGELADQGRHVAEETREQIEAKAAAGTQQLARAFRDLGQQTQALAEGRPEDAPGLIDYVARAADGFYGAADRLSNLSGEIDQEGMGSVLDDLQTFARRRPGAFLLGAAAVGFGIGRVVKAEKQRRSEDDEVYGQGNGATSTRPRATAATGLRRPQPAIGSRAVR